MSGTATPSGLSSLNAKRDSEDIELEWTISDLDLIMIFQKNT